MILCIVRIFVWSCVNLNLFGFTIKSHHGIFWTNSFFFDSQLSLTPASGKRTLIIKQSRRVFKDVSIVWRMLLARSFDHWNEPRRKKSYLFSRACSFLPHRCSEFRGPSWFLRIPPKESGRSLDRLPTFQIWESEAPRERERSRLAREIRSWYCSNFREVSRNVGRAKINLNFSFWQSSHAIRNLRLKVGGSEAWNFEN